MSPFIFVLGCIFLGLVAPLWIIFHFITRWRQQRTLSSADEQTLAELFDVASRLEARIVALERVVHEGDAQDRRPR